MFELISAQNQRQISVSEEKPSEMNPFIRTDYVESSVRMKLTANVTIAPRARHCLANIESSLVLFKCNL